MFHKNLFHTVNRAVLSLALVIGWLPPMVSAAPRASVDLPDQAGVYAVPGHPNLRLKVIVYHGKPESKGGKPAPSAPTELCGLTDPDSTTPTLIGDWKLMEDWNYRLNVSSRPSTISASEVSTLTANAFGAWNQASGNTRKIIPNGTTSLTKAQFDGQSIVSWGRTSGTALATTYIWYDTSTSPYAVREIDMIMNQKFSWEWSDPSKWVTPKDTTCAYQGVYDAQNIMTHEVGHWFGMDDAYDASFTNNTMYGYGSKTETKKNTLTSGDIAALDILY